MRLSPVRVMLSVILFALGSQSLIQISRVGSGQRQWPRAVQLNALVYARTQRLTRSEELELSQTVQSSLAFLSLAVEEEPFSRVSNKTRHLHTSPSFSDLATALNIKEVGPNWSPSPTMKTISSTKKLALLLSVLGKGVRARDVLAVANLQLVQSAVWRKTKGGKKGGGSSVFHGDLVQEGVVGLLRAAEKYDGSKFETKFSTYATPWVKAALSEGERKQQSLVRIPQEKDGMFKAIEKFQRDAQEREYHYPGQFPSSPPMQFLSSSEEAETAMAEALGLSSKAVAALLLRQPLRKLGGGSWPVEQSGMQRDYTVSAANSPGTRGSSGSSRQRGGGGAVSGPMPLSGSEVVVTGLLPKKKETEKGGHTAAASAVAATASASVVDKNEKKAAATTTTTTAATATTAATSEVYAAYASVETAISARDLAHTLQALLTAEEFLAVATRFGLPYGFDRPASSSLSPRRRRLTRQRHINGGLRSYPEVAELTNRKPFQSENVVKRGLEKLRQPGALEKLRPFLEDF
mmetsp:Transcript_45757/g.85099  ORF Transcript_45757/g.85099 Transcript_45757/m.85099 type:complete len:521 (-) Transcript_45757:199-1761(-)